MVSRGERLTLNRDWMKREPRLRGGVGAREINKYTTPYNPRGVSDQTLTAELITEPLNSRVHSTLSSISPPLLGIDFRYVANNGKEVDSCIDNCPSIYLNIGIFLKIAIFLNEP